MNGNTGQYGYYNPVPPHGKLHSGPTVGVPLNGNWQEQNGHKLPYLIPGQQASANSSGQITQNFISPRGVQHPNQLSHHPPPSHYIRAPPNSIHPSSGSYSSVQRSFISNSPAGEPQRYPPSNGNYYDSTSRKPTPGQANQAYPMYPGSPSPASQSAPTQRHFLEPRKPYTIQTNDSPRPRFITPSFGAPGPILETIRMPPSSPSFNNTNVTTAKKPIETLNDLLRKPINDNSRHLRQVLTSNLPSLSPSHPSPAGQSHPASIYGAASPVTILPQSPMVIKTSTGTVNTPNAKAIKATISAPKPSTTMASNNRVLPMSQPETITAVSQPILAQDIIESTKPKLMAPKRLKIDNDINMRKVILSLKSGLLAESKWAIDCLLVLSNSPRSVKIQPSLMLSLLEHYKCNLNAIFDDLLDNEQCLESFSPNCTNDISGEQSSINDNCLQVNNEDNSLIVNGFGDDTNLFDSNTGLPIILKHDTNMPIIRRRNNNEEADLLCDKRTLLRDVDSLDTSHITLNFDLEKDTDKPNNKKPKLSCFVETDNKSYMNAEAEMANGERISLFCTRKEKFDRLATRCINISNILYNISFFKDNFGNLLNYPSLFTILSKILLYKHQHRQEMSFGQIDEANDKRKLLDEKENIEELFTDFPHDMLSILRQNSFGIISNLAEDMNLSDFSDNIVFSVLDALLHWSVCRAAIARDPQKPDNVSFQLLALEILVKLTMKESNNDLILATPPYSRLEEFYAILVDSLGRDEDPVIRELSLVILSNLVQTDFTGARIILHHRYSISNIIMFIEQYENTKNPQFVPTPNSMNSHYMVRRACQLLLSLVNASIKDEIRFIRRFEERIRNLALSHLLEEDISNIIADLMFRISK